MSKRTLGGWALVLIGVFSMGAVTLAIMGYHLQKLTEAYCES